MATLQALLSISTLPNALPPSASQSANPRRRLRLVPRSNHVKLSSKTPASSSNPNKVLCQGLSDSDSEFQGREQLGISPIPSTSSVESVSLLRSFVSDHARELTIGSLVFALVCLPDEHALALGPGGPLMEEFWDNVRRYGFYFFTVVSGGLYSLAKPLLDLMKDPSTQILVAVVVIGTFYLMYLTVSTMLGLNDFVYQYAQ